VVNQIIPDSVVVNLEPTAVKINRGLIEQSPIVIFDSGMSVRKFPTQVFRGLVQAVLRHYAAFFTGRIFFGEVGASIQ